MSKDIVRRTRYCVTCDGDTFERTWNFDAEPSRPVFRCDNCGTEVPRITRRRRSNHRIAIDNYLDLRKNWKSIDDRLDALAHAGKITGGALMLHSSVFNHHLKMLSDTDTLSSWHVKYHTTEARRDMEKALQFIVERKT